MGYLFVTGGTGLLGSYLSRELLRAGVKLAVLVRPTKFASARHRIETQLARWEKRCGYALPRPVVVEGDLSHPDLGLDKSSRRWVSDHCTAMFHNAASLTFHHAESRDEEPWRTNFGGTQHVLEFCRQTGIRKFHFTSTAYIGGMREGRVYEHELDVGQEHCNHYTFSKCEAEKLVHAADFLDRPTVYRPGIIIGDSQTGYTSTYHGFYVPLKLVSTLISRIGSGGTSREFVADAIRGASHRLREVLNLQGHERKNYVPVDWIAAAMTSIYTRPEHHGRVYHLTSPRPASVRLTQDVMEEAFLKYTQIKSPAAGKGIDLGEFNWEEFEQMFVEGMDIYRSYWRDDPEFDCTNTLEVLPHLPCPEVDGAMLMLMCRFAIEANFGWPREPTVVPEFDVHPYLERWTRSGEEAGGASPADPPGGGREFLGLQVNGQGGGQWQLMVEGGRVIAAELGLGPQSTATFYLNSRTFERLAKRESTAEQAIGAGRVLIEGNGVPLAELASALQAVAEGNGEFTS